VLNLAELEKRYAEMSDEEFALLSREDLVVVAKPYYEREARRRGLPEPESQAQSTEIPPCEAKAEAETLVAPIPDPEQILREADRRRVARKRELEQLTNLIYPAPAKARGELSRPIKQWWYLLTTGATS
jgi:hypothetical protein